MNRGEMNNGEINRREISKGVMSADLVLTDATIATMDASVDMDVVDMKIDGIGIIDNAALVIKDGIIVWLGKQCELPSVCGTAVIESCAGQWLTPGLVDCHTHLVFAGNRADEFELRLQGMNYVDIAKQGGGIQSTVKATRAASESTLFDLAFDRASAMSQQGVTSLEIKSGYGLDLDTEIKILRVARALEDVLPLTIYTTFLGAHALPVEYAGRADDYIAYVCNKVLPQIAEENRADAVDVFCESIGFTTAQTERVFQAAHDLGLPVKLHAEQLSNIGGSVLASRYQALSVDHIEFLDEAGVKAIAASDTVAVLLPGAFYCLHETLKPPIKLLRKYKVPMAVATDFNPGSSPMGSLPLMMNMGCHLFGLSAQESLFGATINGARALGVDDIVGSLAVGKQADIVSWNIDHPRDLVYQFGLQPVHKIWKAGKMVI
jgi:imidazolonepropionase